MSDFSIRELSESDWLDYKTIRLRSLLESPESFGSTYERESAFQTEQWRARLRVSSATHDAVTLLALVRGSYAGLLSCVIKKSDSRSASLYQMWVAPEHRRGGVAREMVVQAKKWALVRNARNLYLSVSTVNVAAMSLYKKSGFEPTGDVELLREGSSIETQTMEAKLVTADY